MLLFFFSPLGQELKQKDSPFQLQRILECKRLTFEILE